MTLEHFSYQDQTFAYTDKEMRLPAKATEQLLDILRRWQNVFPYEATRIQKECGVPSLFVRFDCVVSADGNVQIYEIQEGPAWMGYTGLANPTFSGIRDNIAAEWPGIKLLRDEGMQDKDDDLWLPKSSIEEALSDNNPLIVRDWLPPSLSANQMSAITGKSLRPVVKHNDKNYGLYFGWWRLVTREDVDQLPWDSSFVLKPQYGFWSKGIVFWKPHERDGRSTKTQILQALEEQRVMCLQPLIEPLSMEMDGVPYNIIYRPYFGYSKKTNGWVPMHGVWTGRPAPTLRIHGASDAISGPLMCE